MSIINILKETAILIDKKDDIGYRTYCSSISKLKNYILNNTNKKNRNILTIRVERLFFLY